MDTLAARLREAFLGTETGEAVPFDELKDAVRDRWQRVADAAALRVPFSDAQIERMAEAAHTRRMRDEERTKKWKELPLFAKDAWRQGIRAALAAGGLEPCAVPDYDPDDVALTPIERVLRKRLADVDAKVERQRKNLNQLYTANADLRDQLAAADLDLADKAFYIREFASVSAERDALRECDSVPDVDPPAAQVEALARVLDKWHVCTPTDGHYAIENSEGIFGGWRSHDGLEEICEIHNAAIAHLATRPEGLPTAEEIKYLPGKPHVFNNELLIAAYKALKTRHALEWDDETNKDGWQRVLDVVRNATYETLRPWLRDPVGFELDVTADEALRVYANGGKSIGGMHNTLDLCRSRIRPVYECKECAARAEAMMRPQPEIRCAMCAEWEKDCRALSAASRSIDARIAARAALEGE